MQLAPLRRGLVPAVRSWAMVSGWCEADGSWAVDATGHQGRPHLIERAVAALLQTTHPPSSWVIVPLEDASFNTVPVHRKLAPPAVKITRVAS